MTFVDWYWAVLASTIFSVLYFAKKSHSKITQNGDFCEDYDASETGSSLTISESKSSEDNVSLIDKRMTPTHTKQLNVNGFSHVYSQSSHENIGSDIEFIYPPQYNNISEKIHAFHLSQLRQCEEEIPTVSYKRNVLLQPNSPTEMTFAQSKMLPQHFSPQQPLNQKSASNPYLQSGIVSRPALSKKVLSPSHAKALPQKRKSLLPKNLYFYQLGDRRFKGNSNAASRNWCSPHRRNPLFTTRSRQKPSSHLLQQMRLIRRLRQEPLKTSKENFSIDKTHALKGQHKRLSRLVPGFDGQSCTRARSLPSCPTMRREASQQRPTSIEPSIQNRYLSSHLHKVNNEFLQRTNTNRSEKIFQPIRNASISKPPQRFCAEEIGSSYQQSSRSLDARKEARGADTLINGQNQLMVLRHNAMDDNYLMSQNAPVRSSNLPPQQLSPKTLLTNSSLELVPQRGISQYNIDTDGEEKEDLGNCSRALDLLDGYFFDISRRLQVAINMLSSLNMYLHYIKSRMEEFRD